MNDKKNIDRLFQERFKDFESDPDDKIWIKIHDSLHEKKSKKVIPLWWKLSGIAAIFVLAFLIFNPFSDNFTDGPAVVIAPEKIKNSDSTKINPETETRIAVEVTNSKENELSESSTENDNNSNQPSKERETKTKFNLKSNSQSSKNTAVAKILNVKKQQDIAELNIISAKAIAFDSSAEKAVEESLFRTKEESTEADKVFVLRDRNRENTVQNDKDSSSIASSTEPNPLEEILKKKNNKEKAVADAKKNRWQVTTNVAPIYFNSVSNGSPIEAQFEENSKSYESNVSIGVGVQYAVNKKLSVRTGVNKVNLGYATNDVVFFGTLAKSGISNLSTNDASSHIEVMSANNAVGLRPFDENLDNTEKGVLNQRMGYFEIPLEISYAVVNRKFGVQVIGGMSTLYLNDNSVSVQSVNTTMSLGEANNLNTIHFSGNAGVGFSYKFWNSFEAHFEPTLKYQFNTFSRDAGNFKPYFVGLYTGVSFKF